MVSSTTEEPSSASQTLCSIVEGMGIAEYMPASLAGRTERITEAKLKCRYEGESAVYTYTVSWEEDYSDPNSKSRKRGRSVSRGKRSNTTKRKSEKKEKKQQRKKKEKSDKSSRSTKQEDSKIYGTGFDYEKVFRNASAGFPKSPDPRWSLTNSELDELKKKAPRASNSILYNRKCDGPCKELRPIRELHLIGLCEHAICDECLENAPFISANLGGSGCANQKCYLTDVAALCPDPDRRHRKFQRLLGLAVPKTKKIPDDLKTALPISESTCTESADSCSRGCVSSQCPSLLPADSNCTRLVLVNIYLHECADDTKKNLRLYQSLELCSDLTLEKACGIIMSENSRFSLKKMKKRMYIAKNKSRSPCDWVKIEREQWKQSIDNFWDSGDTVNLVLNCTK